MNSNVTVCMKAVITLVQKTLPSCWTQEVPF